MRGAIGYVVDRQEHCIGFVLRRGPRRHEAYDRDEQSLGSFSTAVGAANAVFDAERGTKSHHAKRERAHAERGTMSHE